MAAVACACSPGAGGGGAAALGTHLPTISLTVLVKTPFRARARLAAGRQRK